MSHSIFDFDNKFKLLSLSFISNIKTLIYYLLSIIIAPFLFISNLAFNYFLKTIGLYREKYGNQHQLSLILGIDYSNTLFQKLKKSNTNTKQYQFQSHRLKNQESKNNFYVVSCPFLNMKESIEEREKCIEIYQKFFKREALLKSQIKCLLLAVDYQRNDLMKNCLYDVAKWFQKYRDLIVILVTSFEKAEDKTSSRNELTRVFSQLLQDDEKRLILVSSEDDSNQLNMQFLKVAQHVNQNSEFTPKDTIFEELEEEESNQLLQQLQLTKLNQNR
ncbi:unnamed protein product [Paramecium sonneborni]|uniref:Transmembrane protein n=1 Tax=Paramecium sonneborni TaxID=65129 RepID=A0A8S1NMW5_9CILI|nr:unnamed protein product [Paramecium sonneborni]